MSSIADIFASVRLDLDTGKFVADAVKTADTAGLSMGQRLTASIKNSWSGAAIGKGFVQGLGIAGALGAVNLVSNAVSGLTGIIGDSITAFNEEQVSIQKLSSSLRANVPNWDGNTSAIERVIKAREDLGFTDDEQRASLALTVAATHDVNEALRVQAVAMDLARFKGISLADATDALTRVEAGSYRILKSLGIELKNGATQTDALAAVEKVAGDQAAAFAQTNEGKLLVSQAKVNDAMEKLGSAIAPAAADAMLAVADAITAVTNAAAVLTGGGDQGSSISDSIQKLIDTHNIAGLQLAAAALRDATDKFKHPELVFAPETFNLLMGQLNDVNYALTHYRNLADDASTATTGLGIAVDGTASAMEANRGSIGDALASIEAGSYKAGNQIVKIGSAAKGAISSTRTATRSMAQAWADLVTALTDDAKKLISDAFDPIIAKDTLLADNATIAADKRVLASKKATAQEKADARSSLDSTMQDAANQLVTLAEAGDTTSSAFKTGLANLKTYAAGTKGAVHTALLAAIADIEKLKKEAANAHPTITFKVKIPKFTVDKTGHVVHVPTHGGYDEFASGGTPPVGVPYWVGERGPELRVDSTPGRIIPHDQAMAMGGTFNITVNAGADTSLLAARRFGQAILDEVAGGLRDQRARGIG